MNKGITKREFIFNRFVANRNLLIDHGIITGVKDFYICPICLRPHSDLTSVDPLTLEDAPPKSLGGSANSLTCKSCNNTLGHSIDFHLSERLRELDSRNFTPGTQTEVKVKIGNETFQSTIIIDDQGRMMMSHSKKNNNPLKLEEKMRELRGDVKIDMSFLNTRVIPERLEYALLKTGYLLAYERFGYTIILDPCFDIVREQLLKCDAKIYPNSFWVMPPYPKSSSGVYYVLDRGLECLFVLFCLNTGVSEKMFGVFLPLPIHPINQVIDRLNNKYEVEKGFYLALFPKEQEGLDYLTDIENIKAHNDWINERITYYAGDA